jgi:hypothetical protein
LHETRDDRQRRVVVLEVEQHGGVRQAQPGGRSRAGARDDGALRVAGEVDKGSAFGIDRRDAAESRTDLRQRLQLDELGALAHGRGHVSSP